eukprot:6316419-Pyramimonas_sp.AAC.1
MSPASAIALSKDRSRHLLAKRARSRSRSTTPTRRDVQADFDEKLRRAQAQDEEQRGQDPRSTL